MTSSATTRRRSREGGEITWVTLVLLASLLGGGYLAVVWVPVYIVRYEVGMVATEFVNKAVHNRDDAALVSGLCNRLAKLDQITVPAVDLRPEDVTWQRDTTAVPPTLHLAFEYTAVVHYPIFDRFTEKTFGIERSQDIQPVKW
jgi:hypothetical protein